MSLRASSQTNRDFIRKQSLETQGDQTSKRLTYSLIGVFLTLVVYSVAYLFFDKPYVAVYLTTGDVYFGRLSHTPGFKLSDPWFIERGQNGDFSLRRFTDAVWKPSDTLDISSDHIVFWNRLPSDSPVVSVMEGRTVANQNSNQLPAQDQTSTGQPPVSSDKSQPSTQKKANTQNPSSETQN